MQGFHVTLARNVPSILAFGLEPRIGPRSRRVCEFTPAIYLFKNREEVEDGLMNWMGNFFKHDEPLVLLEVNIPPHCKVETSPHTWEIKVVELITPKYIISISDNL